MSSNSPDVQLATLRRQYYALVPPYLLRIPSASALCSPELLDYLSDEPQPEAGYRRLFWRRLLPQIESAFSESEDDVDERIYEAVAGAMATPGTGSGIPLPSPKTFIYGSPMGEKRITLYEEQVAVQAGTTGLRTWTAALHLAHHFLRDPTAPFGTVRPVIELGAGTGFLSIVLAQSGVDVIATDLGDDGEMDQRQTPLARLTANLALNHIAIPALPLDWADATLPAADRPPAWTAAMELVDGQRRNVIAADVIYDPDIVPLLVNAIWTLLTEGSDGLAVAVLAATVRNEETFALFLSTCGDRGLETEILALPPMDEEDPTFWDTAMDRGTRVEIVRIQKK